jgi:hypothetical protein
MSVTGSAPSSFDSSHATLSTRTFPRRVRTLLEGIFELVTGEMDRRLIATLDGLEQQLFKLAEQARSNDVQLHCLEALGTIKRGRFDLMPRYIALLESSLANVRDVAGSDTRSSSGLTFSDLSLVAEADMDETTLLHEISSRAEMRASLPLFLLSQRFGVMAGKPALDSDALPIGPVMLCRHLRGASHCFELSPEHRQLLFRQFDRHVMTDYVRLIDGVNAYLVNQGVLPNLAYLPARLKTNPRREDEAKPAQPALPAVPIAPRQQPVVGYGLAASPAHVASATVWAPQLATFTGWPGEAIVAAAQIQMRPTSPSPGEDIYTNLRELLQSSRPTAAHGTQAARGYGQAQPGIASATDVQSVLGLLQRRPYTPVMVNGQPRPQSINHVKQDLLAQLRQLTGTGPAPALASEDTDTIDLVGMLFDEIMRDVRPNSPAASLLSKLQVPLLRVALTDKGFFNQQEHPARQMLDAVAETGAYWAGEDAADRELFGNVEKLVERIGQEFDGDISLFNSLLADLANQTQAVMRRAELAERRHVEAARGKEKLAIAQAHASRIMAEITNVHPVPKFTRALLNQAWTDVLALTALRHGEDSDEWRRQVEVATEIAASASAVATGAHVSPADPQQAAELGQHVEQSLMQVGYHADEAAAIGQRLSTGTEDNDDSASRTEIAIKLKARARLGENTASKPKGIQLPPLSTHEQECMDRIHALPFGTWLEFVTNQQGDCVRRRLSWFSPVSGHCLFINHRGQRVGDYTLDTLARAMARNQVRLVEPKKESLLDRALHKVMQVLRGSPVPTPETSAGA